MIRGGVSEVKKSKEKRRKAKKSEEKYCRPWRRTPKNLTETLLDI